MTLSELTDSWDVYASPVGISKWYYVITTKDPETVMAWLRDNGFAQKSVRVPKWIDSIRHKLTDIRRGTDG